VISCQELLLHVFLLGIPFSQFSQDSTIFVGFESFCPAWPQNSVQDATCTGFAKRLKAFRKKSLLEVNISKLPESAVVKEEKHLLG